MALLFGTESAEHLRRLAARREALRLEGRAAPGLVDRLHSSQSPLPRLVLDRPTLAHAQRELSSPARNAFSGRFAGCRIHEELAEEYPFAGALFHEALEFLVGTAPAQAAQLSVLGSSVLPVRQQEERPTRRRCFTHVAYPGILFLSFVERVAPWTAQKPFAALSLAIDLIHEVGHQALYLLQHADRIIIKAPEEGLYSPVRRVHRPAILAFHAAVASAFMLEVFCAALAKAHWLSPAETDFAARSLAAMVPLQRVALDDLRVAELTDVGNVLWSELDAQWTRAGSFVPARLPELAIYEYFSFTHA